MTLITYPTRVHFADGVLEEALRSELERQGHRFPLILYEDRLEGSLFHARLFSSLPRRAEMLGVPFEAAADLHAVRDEVRARAADVPVDAIVAFGSARAIELARKCRRALSEGQGARLDLFAIPGADGLPDPCTRNLESWRAGLPSILICDPTLTFGADHTLSLSASVTSFARCLESYLAAAYNPPADGMALDGFLRCARNLHRLGTEDGPDVRRELMAACLNAMMAQEKGVGPTQVLARELAARAPDGADAGSIARLLLPGIVTAMAPTGEKPEALRSVLGRSEPDLGDGVRAFLSDLPFRASLSDMGLTRGDLDSAARTMAGRPDIAPETAARVLDSVY
ncbi:iron-containing alcohol dehydrogenase [Oceaniglobus roseus]|uniref:iron-containing alcohol dehydrogenase n=1 Tax=Oceaniglobus roseus TaxID=1737570 RepID=UPI000C7EA072|nr:iron-containing alcohol dehydrogenase [Kandeliimicrobium roseum]